MMKIVIQILGSILVCLISLKVYKKRKIRALYKNIWRKTKSLKPTDILDNRPFDAYYYERDFDYTIKKVLDSGDNFLLVGPPLAGKSRAIYELLSKSKKVVFVITPNYDSISIENFSIPRKRNAQKMGVLFLDDLNRFVKIQNFEYLITKYLINNIQIIATCRSGMEYRNTANKFLEKNIDLESIFEDNIIKIKKLTRKEGKEIARNLRVLWKNVSFDGTVGSILMKLKEMQKRFDECNSIEKSILRSIKALYRCGIILGSNIFPIRWAKAVCKRYELKGNKYEWISWFEALQGKELLEIKGKTIHIEDAYLEQIVAFEAEIPLLELCAEMIECFRKSPKELFMLGIKINFVGRNKADVLKYIKAAIYAYETALKAKKAKKMKSISAILQINLGDSYNFLAEIENTRENCIKAIKANEEAMKIYTSKRFPLGYAIIQNNLGNSYNILAEAENILKHCKRAIDLYKKALEYLSYEKFPFAYAYTIRNLGSAYRKVGDVTNTIENCKKAIQAHKEALKVFSLEQHPQGYSAVMNGLGCIYHALAQVINKKDNCRKAIKAYKERLRVIGNREFPFEYANTKMNIGNAYVTLAKVEDTEKNSSSALDAYQDAIRIWTRDIFPKKYAQIINNLGIVYRILAELRDKDKEKNCKKAIRAFNQALKYRTLRELPLEYARTMTNLGNAYATLAVIKDRKRNCENAINAYTGVLKVRNAENQPLDYIDTLIGISNTHCILAKIENKEMNCRKAITIYDEIYEILSHEDKYPELYKDIVHNLEELNACCKCDGIKSLTQKFEETPK